MPLKIKYFSYSNIIVSYNVVQATYLEYKSVTTNVNLLTKSSLLLWKETYGIKCGIILNIDPKVRRRHKWTLYFCLSVNMLSTLPICSIAKKIKKVHKSTAAIMHLLEKTEFLFIDVFMRLMQILCLTGDSPSQGCCLF